MAQPITALAGKIGGMTINSVNFKITRWSIKINNDTIKYATTAQTADSDSQYWWNILSGLNGATIDFDGYWDNNATTASRYTGSSLGARAGTAGAGTIYCGYSASVGFSAVGVFSQISGGIDAESTKPSVFSGSFTVDGPVTYPS